MNRYLQLVQIAKRDLNMDDDIYRDLLQRVTGKRSAKGLSDRQLSKVLDEMKRLGFRPKPTYKRKEVFRSRIANKIRAVWIMMARQGFLKDHSDKALDVFVFRMTTKINSGIGVKRIQWLNNDLAAAVLEALKKWHYRCMIDSMIEKKINIPLNENETDYAGYSTILNWYECTIIAKQ